jgi:hypothetical protein
MVKSILAVCLVCAAFSHSILAGEKASLFSIKKDGKCGYIDSAGKIVIGPQFDTCWSFYEDRAGVIVADRLGFIDRTGNFIGRPIYNYDLVYFSEGFAQISLGDRQNGTRRVGFIDVKGEPVFLPFADVLYSFSEGLAAFTKGDRMGYIDRRMNVVIEPKYKYAGSFGDGRAKVEDENGDFYYIDRSGRKAIDRDGGSFSEGLAFFEVKNKYTGSKYGFIDTKGEVVIEPQFARAEFFYEGLCAAQDWDSDKWGFIDKTGKFVVKPQYDEVERFSEGLGQVAVGDKWGFVDKTGKTVISLKFDAVGDFENGIAQVKIDGRWCCYIDRRGKFVWQSGE